MKLTAVATVAFLVYGGTHLNAGTLVLDSFTEGTFGIEWRGIPVSTETLSGPPVTFRTAFLTFQDVEPDTLLTSACLPGGGVVFSASGSTSSGEPLSMTLKYYRYDLFDITSYSAFDFEFSEVAGAGDLVVQIGAPAAFDVNTIRIPILSAQHILVTYDQLNVNSVEPLSAFSSLLITFEAASPTFGFTLDKISLVPEPADWGEWLGALGLGLVVLCKCRSKR